MSNFDDQLRQTLSGDDESFIKDSFDEGFYASVFDSLKSKSSIYRWTWVGIFIFSGILMFSIWKFFQAETVKDQIMWAALAIMGNSAQIALKIWFNMRLSRRDIMRELKKTQLALAHSGR